MIRQESGIKVLKLLNVLSFMLMIAVNALANILPINGITTAGVSNLYPNLFTPAGITFSIWGLIYVLLAGFVVYQLGLFKGSNTADIIERIGVYFIISSLANAAWIFSWHYKVIPISMILMLLILISLFAVNAKLNAREFSLKEKVFVRLPFSIYFGWITVATIANLIVLLISSDWDAGGWSQEFWTIIAVGVALFIGMGITLKFKDIAYGLVIVWAYSGILVKHLSANGFAGKYPEIIITVILAIVILLISVLYLVFKGKNSAKPSMV